MSNGALREVHRTRNPFLRPDIGELVETGFAAVDEPAQTIVLTPAAIERMRPWTRAPEPHNPAAPKEES